MQRTTIMLPADLKMRAQQAAHARGISLGVLIREALAWTLDSEEETRSTTDPLCADNTVCTGDVPSDLAADHDASFHADEAQSLRSGDPRSLLQALEAFTGDAADEAQSLRSGDPRSLLQALEAFTGDAAVLHKHFEEIARERQRQREEARQRDAE